MRSSIKVGAVIIGLICGLSMHSFAYFLEHGNLVFDQTRFNDSVKNTAQVVARYYNKAIELANRYSLATLLNGGFDKSTASAVQKDAGSQSDSGDSLLNSVKNLEDTVYKRSWKDGRSLSDSDYTDRLNDASEQLNYEAATVVFDSNSLQSGRDKALQDVASIQTKGVAGERQKANALAVLKAFDAVDKNKALAATLTHDVHEQEKEAAQSRMDREDAKKGTFYGYDPYHPTEYDKNHKPSSTENFGFIEFGK